MQLNSSDDDDDDDDNGHDTEYEFKPTFSDLEAGSDSESDGSRSDSEESDDVKEEPAEQEGEVVEFLNKFTISRLNTPLLTTWMFFFKFYKCTVCLARSTTAKGMQVHLQRHLDLRRKRGVGIECNLCQKILRDKRECQLHIFRVHLNAKNYACSTCHKYFYSMSNRNEHIKNVHGDVIHFFI